MPPHTSPSLSGDESLGPLLIDIACADQQTAIVTPAGEADLCNAPRLRRALDHVIGAHPRVIVDLDKLTFMDASILDELVDAQQRISASGGIMRVRCRTRLGRRLLTITGLDDLLDRGL